jgi:hypothetical protein
MMFRIFMRGGITRGRTSLCATCSSAHIVTGYRESEMVVICTEAEPHVPIRFEVKECTEYRDRHRPAPPPPARVLGFFVDEPIADKEEREMVASN